MNHFKKRLIFSAVSLLFLSPLRIFAGGVLLSEKGGIYEISPPSVHSVFIDHQDEVQNMIVSFRSETVSNNLLWIFPVPATDKKVDFSISSEDPSFRGKNLHTEAGKDMERVEEMIYLSQVWPPFYAKRFEKEPEVKRSEPSPKERVVEYVRIHRHLGEKEMEVEKINAEDKDHLLDFLKERDVEMNSEAVSSLKKYFNKNFSFIISFMEAPDKKKIEGEKEVLKSIKREIKINFPTEKIYYPLSVMQSYGKKTVPVIFNVTGHVSPELFEEIKDARVDYYINSELAEGGSKYYLKSFADTDKFTKIRVASVSENLTYDLNIFDKTPSSVSFLLSFHNHSIIYFLFLFIALSFFTGMITGPIVCKKDRNKKGLLKWGKTGLFNCLSIVGFAVRVGFEKMEDGKIKKPLLVILYSLTFTLLSFFVINRLFDLF